MGTGVLPFQPSQKNERNEDQLEMRLLSKENYPKEMYREQN